MESRRSCAAQAPGGHGQMVRQGGQRVSPPVTGNRGKVRGHGQTGACVKGWCRDRHFRRQRGPVSAALAQMLFVVEKNYIY
jgi:hypothetical protein